MWLPRVDFRHDRGVHEDFFGGTAISPARAGSNILEYGRLSELTRDLQYIKNVPRIFGLADLGDCIVVAAYQTKRGIHYSRDDCPAC